MLHNFLVITVAVLAAASPTPPRQNAASNELYEGRAGAALAAGSRFPAELNVAPNELYQDSADSVQAAASPFPPELTQAAASPSPPELTVAPYKLFENSPSAINFADKDLADLISGMPVGDKLVDAVNKASTGDTEDLIDQLECPICFENFDTATLATLGCGHTFHESCYRADGKDRCALCRHEGEVDDILDRETDLRKFLGLLESKQWIAPAKPPPPPPGVKGRLPRPPPVIDPQTLAVWREMLRRLEGVLRTGIDEIRANIPRASPIFSGMFNRWGSAERADNLRWFAPRMNWIFERDLFEGLELSSQELEHDDYVTSLEVVAARAVSHFLHRRIPDSLCSSLSRMRTTAQMFGALFVRTSRANVADYVNSVNSVCPVL